MAAPHPIIILLGPVTPCRDYTAGIYLWWNTRTFLYLELAKNWQTMAEHIERLETKREPVGGSTRNPSPLPL